MIKLRFEEAVAYYILFFVVFFIFCWVAFLSRKKEYRRFAESKIWRCGICTFVYCDTAGQKLSICPRCGSYNEIEGKGGER